MKAFKPYELCPLNQKPAANIPDEWPWQVVDCTEEQALDLIAQGFTVFSDVDYEAYIVSHQDNYDAWFAAWDAERKTSEAYQRFTIAERKQFADELMQELKLMNINAGVSLSQSLWLHHRLRNLTFTVAPGHVEAFPPLAPLLNITLTIDFLNLVVSGDVETAYSVLICAPADDMSQPYHAFSNEFKGFIQLRIAQFLGWA